MTITQAQYQEFAPLQKRVLKVLSAAQIFSGIGSGAVISVGALLAVDLSGSQSWGGSVTTVMTLGSAIAAMPLAQYASRRGRRIALVTGISIAWLGVMTMIASAILGSFPLVLLGGALIGAGSAVNLQARFAATDLAAPERRSRDLSLVVWTTTVGSVAGPNLLGVGEKLGGFLGLPEHAGIFVISGAGMMASALILWFGLRPDPSLVLAEATNGVGVATKRKVSLRQSFMVIKENPEARAGLVAIVIGHAVMVSVMSVTSVHLDAHGAALTVIGFTISLHVVGMYAFSPIAGWLSDKIGAKTVVLIAGIILVFAALFSGLGQHNHTLVTVGLFLLGLGWSFATIAGASHITAHVDASQRLAIQGASDTLQSLAGAFGGVFAGLTLASIGYGGLNAAAGILAIIMITVMVLSRRKNTSRVLAS